jgi:N-acetylneuraminate synthase/N,N'-diacetyllegionaminate synthase
VLQSINIDNKTISKTSPVFIIAEAGVNHNGNLEMAKDLIKRAAACGADCIKFQTFKAERVVTKYAPKAKYQMGTTDKAESQLDMLKKIELRPEDHAELKEITEELDMVFLSTPYNFEDIDILENIGVSAYKVASGQIVELPFLRKIASKEKPVLLSTGMATLEEIDEALATILETGNEKVVLLQCTTNYPSKIEDANLRVIPAFQSEFSTLTGYSDHTVGEEAAISVVALGARIIEKHFTLDKNLQGPDHSSSMIPDEFNTFVRKIRRVETALGSAIKTPTKIEKENAVGMRRSIVASRNIKKGETINEESITFKRPANGLAPRFYDNITGKRATRDIVVDEIIQKDMIQW